MAITTAKGTILQLSDGPTSPETYASISEVRSITGPTVKPKVVDVTAHSSPGYWNEMLAVLIAAGDVSFEVNFNITDATQNYATGMWKQMVGLILNRWQMTFPNSAGVLTWQGYVGQHEFMAPVDNVLGVKIQIAITGPVYANGN